MTKVQQFSPAPNKPEEKKEFGALCLKIEQVSAAIGRLQEDGENTYSNYRYISDKVMMAALRTHLASFKLSILPQVIDDDERDGNSGNKAFVRTNVVMLFTIVDCDTGYSIDLRFTGGSNDTGGKSAYIAETQTMKYFLKKLFKVSSSEDIDGDSKTTESVPTKAISPKKQTPPRQIPVVPQNTSSMPIESIKAIVSGIETTALLKTFFETLPKYQQGKAEVVAVFTDRKNEVKELLQEQG